jgi:hypothetical protein
MTGSPDTPTRSRYAAIGSGASVDVGGAVVAGAVDQIDW